MTMRRILDLREEEVARFPRADLLDSEVVALHESEKFEIEAASLFNGYTYGIRSRGWIGQIPIGDDLLLRVAPKVPVSNLFRMLEVAYSLRSFKFFEDEIQIESLEDVYERIVSILARRVLDRARKGLYRGYLNETDDLPYVRGRIDVLGALLNSVRGIPRIPCQYEEHTADLEDNRILLWTLHQVRRQALRQEKVRIELDRARRALAGTITLEQYLPIDCANRLYHRLNDDYSPLHGLCRFILEQTGPSIHPGDRTFIPFELDMPKLCELFVAEWLRANPPSGMAVRCKYTAALDSNLEMEIHVDIVLCDSVSRQPVAILDTKYKSTDQPSEDDIRQVTFYARELEVNLALLVYPRTVPKPLRLVHGRDTIVESVVFNIGTPLDAAGAAFLSALNERLS